MMIEPIVLILLFVSFFLILIGVSWITYLELNLELKEERALSNFWRKRLSDEKEENSKLRNRLNEKIEAHDSIAIASSSEWIKSNIILNDKAIGIDSTNNTYRIGDGNSNWIELEEFDFSKLEDILICQAEDSEQGYNYFGSSKNWINE